LLVIHGNQFKYKNVCILLLPLSNISIVADLLGLS
jgi:hypothetical protein